MVDPLMLLARLAIALSPATYRKMLQNLGWAAGYNVVGLPLAAGVLDGEATDWGGHLCSSEDARGLVVKLPGGLRTLVPFAHLSDLGAARAPQQLHRGARREESAHRVH